MSVGLVDKHDIYLVNLDSNYVVKTEINQLPVVDSILTVVTLACLEENMIEE